MKYLFSLLLSLSAIAIFSGCAQTEPAVPSKSGWPIVVDSSINHKIMVTNSISRQRSDGLSEIQFSLKNRLPHTSIDALYQAQWFDRDGFRIKSITDTFAKIHLGPSDEKTFSLISTSTKAVTYKIIIVDYEKNKQRTTNEDTQNSN